MPLRIANRIKNETADLQRFTFPEHCMCFCTLRQPADIQVAVTAIT